MWMLLLSLAVAQDWMVPLLAPSAPRWAHPDDLLQLACEAGDASACAASGDVEGWLAGQCAEGRVSACLGGLWALEPRAPREAGEGYRALCEGGHLPACAEAARTMWEGIGPWHSRRQGRALAERSCAAGQARGCAVLAAIEAGRWPTRAWERGVASVEAGGHEAAPVLHVLDPERSVPWLQTSCDAGQTEACERLALHRSPRPAWRALERACALGSDSGCVRAALADPDASASERELRLAGLCEGGVGRACTEARWLRAGAEPEPDKVATVDAEAARMAIEYAVPWMRECAREAVDDGARVDGWLTFDLWGAPDGTVGGVAWRDDPTGVLSRCIADALVGQEALTASPWPQVAEAEVYVRLHADLEVMPDHAMDSEAVAKVRRALRRPLEREAQRCFLDAGGSAFDRVFLMVDTAWDRAGSPLPAELFESSGLPEADACVMEAVGALAPEVGPLEGRAPVALRLNFGAIDLRW